MTGTMRYPSLGKCLVVARANLSLQPLHSKPFSYNELEVITTAMILTFVLPLTSGTIRLTKKPESG